MKYPAELIGDLGKLANAGGFDIVSATAIIAILRAYDAWRREQIGGDLVEFCAKADRPIGFVPGDYELGRARAVLDASGHADLVAALSGLVNRLDEIHVDPAYKSVWTVNQLHAGPYTGPTYVDELARAREALKAAGQRP